MRFLIPLSLLGLLLGCSGRPARESFARVELGMSEAQVQQILGAPASTFVLPDDQSLKNWTYSDKDWVNFHHGKVFAVVYDEKDLVQAPPLDQSAPLPEQPGGPATPAPAPLVTPAPSQK